MIGGIVYVEGLYGAGKTTLVKAALDGLPALKVIPTLITRAPRPGELETGYEYEFVSLEEYQRRRAASSHWDETQVRGTFYGTDAEGINRQIRRGQWFIVAGPPTVAGLLEMQKWYEGEITVIWLDVSASDCNARVMARDGERARERLNDEAESARIRGEFRRIGSTMFCPVGSLDEDGVAFVKQVKSLTKL